MADQDLSDIDEPTALAAAEAQARKSTDAFMDGDLDTLLDYTHSKVLELGGGREKMRATIQAGLADRKTKGQALHSVRVGRPDKLVRAKGDLFTIVPQHLVISMPKGKLLHDGFLVGISSDKGRSWTFIDGAGAKSGEMRNVFPDLPNDLQLPKWSAPRWAEGDD